MKPDGRAPRPPACSARRPRGAPRGARSSRSGAAGRRRRPRAPWPPRSAGRRSGGARRDGRRRCSRRSRRPTPRSARPIRPTRGCRATRRLRRRGRGRASRSRRWQRGAGARGRGGRPGRRFAGADRTTRDLARAERRHLAVRLPDRPDVPHVAVVQHPGDVAAADQRRDGARGVDQPDVLPGPGRRRPAHAGPCAISSAAASARLPSGPTLTARPSTTLPTKPPAASAACQAKNRSRPLNGNSLPA